MVGVHRAGRNCWTIQGKMYDGVRMNNFLPEGGKITSPTLAPVFCDGTSKVSSRLLLCLLGHKLQALQTDARIFLCLNFIATSCLLEWFDEFHELFLFNSNHTYVTSMKLSIISYIINCNVILLTLQNNNFQLSRIPFESRMPCR